MKRLECTKCRELQHLCKCDRRTIDFITPEPLPNDPEYRANSRPVPSLPLEKPA